MKRFVSVLCALALTLALLPASASADGLLGQPFPDFTAVDTEGNAFTLSEALKDHEAVLVNLWATWCPPCRAEFPHLQRAYEKYGDRVAFIALSCEPTDTIEKIEAFRRDYGITFPMGRDEDGTVDGAIGASGIPDTVIVDRFGNAAYLRVGSFTSTGDVERLLAAFLGEGYTETKVLEDIPPEASTRAYSASGSRAVYPEGDGVKAVKFMEEGAAEPFVAYVAEGETVRMRIRIAGKDSPGELIYYDGPAGLFLELDDLLDPETNEYSYEQALPAADDPYPYTYGILAYATREDPDGIEIYVIGGEDRVEEFAGLLQATGPLTWEIVDTEAPEEAAPEAYVLHMEDQYGDPVPGAYALFCTDAACTTAVSGEDGAAVFSGAPDAYHVKLLTVPEGYSFDEGFEFEAGPAYGEWIVRIRKD